MTVRDLFQLEGQVAGVTVGSRGQGPQMARALGEMGGRVAITTRKADELVRARDELASQDTEVLTRIDDLLPLDCIPALVDEAVSGLCAIDLPVTRTAVQRLGGNDDQRGFGRVPRQRGLAPHHRPGARGRRPRVRAVTRPRDMADAAPSPFSSTRPVAAQHAFEVAKLTAFMREHVHGFDGELAVEQFKGGQSNPTLLFSAGGRRYVLRRKPPATLLPSAHAVDREFRVIRALAATEVPVARAHALCQDPLADFAYHCMRWHLPPPQGLAGVDLAALGIPGEAEYLRRYLDRVGAAREPSADAWTFFLVFNMFRLVGILQGVTARALQGNASSAQALETGQRTRPLAEQAWALAQRIGKG